MYWPLVDRILESASQGGSAWSGGILPGLGGFSLPGGVSLVWGGLPGPGGVLPAGGSPWSGGGSSLPGGGVLPVRRPPLVNRITDTCKNITFVAAGKDEVEFLSTKAIR